MSFSLPKEWQDWLNLLLGIWLCASPWPLHFLDDASATNNAVGIGFLVIATEVFTFYRLRLLEEWIGLGLGAWLVISPWLLNITAPNAKLNFIVSGVAVCLLSMYEIWSSWNEPVVRA
jgi:SPW repeat